MAVDTERLHKLLEQASLDLVMLSQDDLVEVSSILGTVENLGREFVEFESEWPPRVINSVKSLLKAVIRDEVPEKVGYAMDLAGEGVTLLQELSRALPASAEPAGDIQGFLRRSAELTGQDFTAPPPPEGAVPKREAGSVAGHAGGYPAGSGPAPGEAPGSGGAAGPSEASGSVSAPGDAAPAPHGEAALQEEHGPDWEDIDKGWGEDDAAAGAGDVPGIGREAGGGGVLGAGPEHFPEEAPAGEAAREGGAAAVAPGADAGGGAGGTSPGSLSAGAAGGSSGSSGEDGREKDSSAASGEDDGGDSGEASGAGGAGDEVSDGGGSGEASGAGGAGDEVSVGGDSGGTPDAGDEVSVGGDSGEAPDAGDEGSVGGDSGEAPGGSGEGAVAEGEGAPAPVPSGHEPPAESGGVPVDGATDPGSSRSALGPAREVCFIRRSRPPGKPTAEIFSQNMVQALENLQMKLVAVEQKTDPVPAMNECIPEFRTIQAGFSLLDLDSLTRLTADTVALMDYVVSEQVPHSAQVTDILLKALTYLIGGVSTMAVKDDGAGWDIAPAWSEEDLKVLRDDLWDARQGMLAPEPAQAVQTSSGASRGGKPKKLGEILVEKGLISEGDLGGLIQAQKTARNVRLGEILVEEGLITDSELMEALDLQEKEGGARRMGEILVAMGRLDHEHVEKALKLQESRKETKLGEILLQQKIGAPEKVAAALREQKQSEFSSLSGQPQGPHTVKVETQKLDGLIDLVGELVITQSLVTSNESVKHLKEQKFNKDLAQVSRITSELQRNAMSLRMVVIKNTFQKMNRLVRDLSHKFEKDIEFTTQGDDTEIDRNMVESIYDPLVHMIRNALDHGIEPADERRAAGKPPKGALVLKAYHQGGNVVIELSDDGRGLNVRKVQEKAEEMGLIQPGETLSVAQAHSIVFQPGFSTTDRVTEISGRGVGMDVVRKSIETLRGKVDFTSVPGQGSSFVIRLPLTLAIIDGMIVRVGDNRYILPTISINESFRPKPEEYFTVKNQGEMIKVRDNLLPLVRLDQIVNVEGATRDPSDALVVVVENEGQRRCLLVDEVLGKQEVVIKSLGERLKYVRSLAGGTILGDGRVGLILDVNGLFDSVGGGFVPSRSGGAPAGGGEADDWGM
ncbi:MAG: chemotaxis protein CheW [Deltaproteobacteria bacterium]|jgi:chemotaxis protein histidine kinase CheA|nr:chemotaxis protein CheW [Deltaproteobacteria bacterium]